jgi:type IV pilus assembly protein PilA
VTTSAATDLKDAASKTIKLTPFTTAGAIMTVAANMGSQVGSFRCQAGDTNPIDTKYLPGSCK